MYILPELGNMFRGWAMLPGDCCLEWHACLWWQTDGGRKDVVKPRGWSYSLSKSVHVCVCLFGRDCCCCCCCCLAVVAESVIAVFAVSHFSTSGRWATPFNNLAVSPSSVKCCYHPLHSKHCLQHVCYYNLIIGVFWAASMAFLVCTVGGL